MARRRKRRARRLLVVFVVFFGGLGLCFSLLGTVGQASGSSSVAAGHHSTTLSGTLSCGQLEALWENAGGSSSTAFMAAEIARAESSGRQYAQDDDSDGSVDYGYWQINSVHGASAADYTPIVNAEAAVQVSDDGTDWEPWVTYKNQSYIGQC